MRKHEQTGVCNWSSIVLGACPTDTYGRYYILFIEDGVCYRINYITASKTGPLLKDSPPPHCFYTKARELQPNLFSNKAVLLSCFFLSPLVPADHHSDQPQRQAKEVRAHPGSYTQGGPGGECSSGAFCSSRGGHRRREPGAEG